MKFRLCLSIETQTTLIIQLFLLILSSLHLLRSAISHASSLNQFWVPDLLITGFWYKRKLYWLWITNKPNMFCEDLVKRLYPLFLAWRFNLIFVAQLAGCLHYLTRVNICTLIEQSAKNFILLAFFEFLLWNSKEDILQMSLFVFFVFWSIQWKSKVTKTVS